MLLPGGGEDVTLRRGRKKKQRTDGNTEIEMQIVEINTHLTHEIISSTPGICEVNLSVTVVLLKKKEKKKRERKRLLQANTTHQSVKGTARLKKSDSDSFLRLSVLFSSPQIRVLSSTDSTFNLYRHEILFIYLLIFYHHC